MPMSQEFASAKLKHRKLISLAEKTSRQHTIDSVVWLSLITLMQQQMGRKEMKDVQFGEEAKGGS